MLVQDEVGCMGSVVLVHIDVRMRRQRASIVVLEGVQCNGNYIVFECINQ